MKLVCMSDVLNYDAIMDAMSLLHCICLALLLLNDVCIVVVICCLQVALHEMLLGLLQFVHHVNLGCYGSCLLFDDVLINV